MDYYTLDKVSWEHSQSLYHAAAHLGREAFFILRPATPYICIGCHQDAQQVIDLDFTSRQSIPVFRREVGGGAVYLDGDQLFYQLILPADHPHLPKNKQAFYQVFLEPVVQTFRAFGVEAEYKPVNDILVKGRKISGNGAAEINEMVVLVGNFILDFNYEMMSKCLRVPDEKFRDKVNKTLRGNLTTIKGETGALPATIDLAEDLIGRFEPLLGKAVVRTSPDEELVHKADALFASMHTPDWLLENDRRRPDTSLKIREGVYVVQNAYKAAGGLIQVTSVQSDGCLSDVHLSGDFFFYPANRLQELEKALEGIPARQEAVAQAIQAYYSRHEIESPGIEPSDIAAALIPAV
jgi:lipoate-protein ligase A